MIEIARNKELEQHLRGNNSILDSVMNKFSIFEESLLLT